MDPPEISSSRSDKDRRGTTALPSQTACRHCHTKRPHRSAMERLCRRCSRYWFKMENIQPKPGKLWEQTKHWTAEDVALVGGALGIFMALNPRALPGAYGFSRFFGAAMVGSALHVKFYQSLGFRNSQTLLQLFDQTVTTARQKEYEKLQNDERAKASLSRIFVNGSSPQPSANWGNGWYVWWTDSSGAWREFRAWWWLIGCTKS